MPDWLPYLETPVPARQFDLDAALALARLPVPDDVRRLLRDRQGQAPEPECVDLPTGGTTVLGPVLLVSPVVDPAAETYTVPYGIDALREWRPTADGKPDFFPFASDTASGWFCLDQRDPAQPVVFVDTALGLEDDGIVLLAPSVTALLARLHD